jgi:DNA-binding NarL/FixJ family response regulator
VTRPVYRYRSTRSPGRPAGGSMPVDQVAVERACAGDRVVLTSAELRVAVVRLAGLSAGRVARRLDVSCRTVQRIRASVRGEAGDG